MSIFSKSDDEYLDDYDGNMFSKNESYEKRKAQLERAHEIASGITMGTFERDEKVWELVNKIKGDK